MPIYEYSCSNCRHKFEVLQKVNEESIKRCPACAKDAVVRLVSAAAFQLKGSGWYATDFKDKGKPSPEAKPEPKATEAKPAEPSTTTSVTTKGETD